MELPVVSLPPWASTSSSLATTTILLATALFLFLFLVTTTTTVLRQRRRPAARNNNNNNKRRRVVLPPGPRPWPVIGNLNLIGALPHRSMHELSATYGPVMSIRLGSVPAIVGSSLEVAEVLLRTQDVSYLDRPRLASGKYTAYNYSGVLWSHYGAYWRQLRKLWMTELLSARQLRLTERVRADEVAAMLRDIHPAAATTGGDHAAAVVFKEHLLMTTVNIISRIVLGKKYVGGGGGGAAAATTPEEFRWMIHEIFLVTGAPHVGDMVPWLSWLDLQGYVGRMKRLAEKFDRIIEHVLREHDERRREEGDAFVPRDMADILLQLADNAAGGGQLEVPLKRDDVKAFVMEAFTGGTDTSSVTVEWAMSELLRNPGVLAKLAGELDRAVGRGRLVGEGDFPALPYLSAVVRETMRLHPVAPLLLPRVSREHTAVAGYDVPPGTRVMVNVWAIGRDPAVWGHDAGEFRPERFLDGESKASGVDVKGQHLELLPFGAGRRMCPAYALGLRMVQLMLANLVHGYAWRLPGGAAPETLDMEEKFAVSVSRLNRLQAIPQPRLPHHVYFGPSP